MKKLYTIIIISFIISNIAYAQDKIPSLDEGIKIKCTAQRDSKFRILLEYQNSITDYYEFHNGNFYSDNLSKMYGKPNKKPKKVSRQIISSKNISFKDYMWELGSSKYKWIYINRKTGAYSFSAHKFYHWLFFFEKINATGTCTIDN